MEPGIVVELANGANPGTEIGLLLRPEAIDISAGSGPQDHPGVVDETAYLGSTLKYYVRLDNGLRLAVRQSSGKGIVPARGTRVGARWASADLHVVHW